MPEPAEWTAALVGLDEEAAAGHAVAQNGAVRVIERDGESLPMTMDYRPDRANVVVVDGRVTAVHSMG